eukprot:g43028.t1
MLGDIISGSSDEVMLFYSAWYLYCPVRYVVADVLCEFLEVAIHMILYVREVYPVGIFQKRKKYNVPVQNEVDRMVVVILDKEHHPVERFVFEISQPPLLSVSSDTLLSRVEQLLRASILKISVCDAILDSNPPGNRLGTQEQKQKLLEKLRRSGNICEEKVRVNVSVAVCGSVSGSAKLLCSSLPLDGQLVSASRYTVLLGRPQTIPRVTENGKCRRSQWVRQHPWTESELTQEAATKRYQLNSIFTLYPICVKLVSTPSILRLSLSRNWQDQPYRSQSEAQNFAVINENTN